MKIILTVFLTAITLGSPLMGAEPEVLKDTMSVEYRSDRPYPSHGVTMAGALESLGISLDNIDSLKLVGDKNSMTAGLTKTVKINQPFWDRYFATAEPYKFRLPSGYRRLEVYVKGEAKPKATIFINETDSCSVKGDPRKLRYMCRGLEQWFMDTLAPPQKGAEQGGADQPATAVESKTEGKESAKPESDKRSQ